MNMLHIRSGDHCADLNEQTQQRMNNIRARTEEVVREKLIFDFAQQAWNARRNKIEGRLLILDDF